MQDSIQKYSINVCSLAFRKVILEDMVEKVLSLMYLGWVNEVSGDDLPSLAVREYL